MAKKTTKSTKSTKKASSSKSTHSKPSSNAKPTTHDKSAPKAKSSGAKSSKPSTSPSGIGGWVVGIVVLVLLIWAVISLPKILPGSNYEAQITYGDLTYNMESAEVDKFFKVSQADNSGLTRDDVKQQLVNLHILLLEAESKGITVDDLAIQAQVDEQVILIQNQISDEQLDLELAKRGFTRDEFLIELRDSIAKDLVIQQLIAQEVYNKLEPTEDDLRAFYDENLAQFAVPKSVSARHILICHENSMRCESERSENEALALASAIKQNIEGGLDFAEAATQYSEGPSSANGGDLGQFYPGQMVQEFDEVAFDAPLGEVSEPVKTAFGYHLITVYGKTQATTVSFEEALPQLGQIYRQEVMAEEESKYIRNVIDSAQVE